jgi:hypothetical protein
VDFFNSLWKDASGRTPETARRWKQTKVVLDTSACQSETVFDGWRNQTQQRRGRTWSF